MSSSLERARESIAVELDKTVRQLRAARAYGKKKDQVYLAGVIKDLTEALNNLR